MKSWLLLFGCNLMWALQFTCVKLVQNHVGPLFTVWGPMTLATLMLCPLVMAERKHKPERQPALRKDIILFAMLALLGGVPAQVFSTWGTRMSLASNAALLTLTTPISTTIFAFLFLGERMTRVRWFGFALAIAGVLLCSNINFHSLNLGGGYLAGNTLILMGTLGSAFYNSYSKKALQRYTPLETLFYSYAGMLLLMTPLVVVEQRRLLVHFSSFTATTWVGLALLTIFHYFLSMVLFLKALTKLDATQAALSNYLVAFFGLPIAAFMLKERLNTSAIIGGAVVLGSTLLVTLWKQKPREAGLAASAVGDPARN